MVNIRRQQGFTLIELVIVIVLIGILAATALPKFADLTTNARDAAAQGVAGALGAAANVAHAQWLANDEPVSITLEGTAISMTTQGWPQAAGAAQGDGSPSAADCVSVWDNILQNPPGVSATADAEDFQAEAAGAVCTYTDEGGSGSNAITYNVTTGAVNI